jgi:hypothetical protein
VVWLGEHIVEILSVAVSTVLSLYIARIAILQNKRITDIEESRQKNANFVFFKIEREDNRILTKELNGSMTRSYERVDDEFGREKIKLSDCPNDKLDKVSLNLKNVGNAHAEMFEVLDFEMLYFNPIGSIQKKYIPVKRDGDIFRRSYVLRDENRYIHVFVEETESAAAEKNSAVEMFFIDLKIRYIDVIIKKPVIENIKFSGTLEGFEYENAAVGIPSDYEKLKMVFDSSAVTYSII